VCVIGGAQAILPFKAGGAVLYPAEDPAAVSRALHETGAQPKGSLVLITEEAAALVPEAIEEFEEAGAYALMIIPSRPSERSVGMDRMRELIIRSVGVDLISRSPAAEISAEIRVEEKGVGK
jgi:V/A-type H+-transporting ATPase subunit F